MFTASVKNYDRGIFIGEETGGNSNIQVGDFEQMLTLPRSGLRIRLPVFYDKMEVKFQNSKQGILPNHSQRNSITDEINGDDHVMD